MNILFIAPNPHRHKTVEGYLQRVLAIDNLFSDQDKMYYDDFSDQDALARSMIVADVIYVHSIYRAEEIIENYSEFSEKIVTDLHGIVPEEEACLGRSERAERLDAVEREVFKYCQNYVAVTDAMVKHYYKKYPTSKRAKWTVLPIFEDITTNYKSMEKSDSVVYAGGAQKWQNIEDMITIIKHTLRSRKFYILTQDKNAFDAIHELKNVTIKTVERDKVPIYYKKASLGFMLRDDIEVNRVACPTKLIEYLAYGVVPIVKFANIGDFSNLGYQYIKVDEFSKSNFTQHEIEKKAEKNFEVYKSLRQKTYDGKMKLLEQVNIVAIDHHKEKISDDELFIKYIARGNKLAQDKIQLTALNHQVKEQVRMINEYGAAVKHLNDELSLRKTSIQGKLNNAIKSFTRGLPGKQ